MRGPLQLPPWPRPTPRLWLTAGAWLLCAVNLLFREEIWAHTPAMKTGLFNGLWLLTLLLLPQLAWLGWRWLQAWPMPWWLEVVATAAYFGSVCLLGLFWVGLLILGFSALPPIVI